MILLIYIINLCLGYNLSSKTKKSSKISIKLNSYLFYLVYILDILISMSFHIATMSYFNMIFITYII